ncbi:hypothetical protein WOLCODRAFT_153407 [Wolfiporia cocos MD-104 SS10]|uniref:Uncharacterized protein n=1 Tax=Wolfiporia cocos (strain MD-104) TaxID=742152 RepID=A0A2H3JMC7_WOLCO|nr:hypothetical protein WOLCODRAFT_153407 [Wolfiporia cocos MD-104 SS10]
MSSTSSTISIGTMAACMVEAFRAAPKICKGEVYDLWETQMMDMMPAARSPSSAQGATTTIPDTAHSPPSTRLGHHNNVRVLGLVQEHEGDLRHKGNVERSVSGLYKEDERRKYDREEERREMARVEQVRRPCLLRLYRYWQERTGRERGICARRRRGARQAREQQRRRLFSFSSSLLCYAPLRQVRPTSDPYANYSTAASLGYTNPDAEHAQAEAECRRTQGVVCVWEVVAPPTPPPPAAPEEEEQGEDVKPEAGQKRASEAVPDDDGEDARRFRLKRRTVGAGPGEIYIRL